MIEELLTVSSLPVLRKLGALREGREILSNEDLLNMIKVWVALEARQLINASVQDVRKSIFLSSSPGAAEQFTNTQIHALVKADMLSPNV